MLRMRGIDKRFGGTHALKGVDFDLRSGEVHALLGENGAGKSTLIKVLSGLVRPDKGIVEIDGSQAPIMSVADAQSVGIRTVHQELELAGPLSVAENMHMDRLPRRWGLVDSTAMINAASDALETLGAEFEPSARVDSLSLGDRQIVEIARAIVKKARFLILDEPTAALPPGEVRKLFEVIGKLRAAGTGIIYVSHRLDEVLEISDRITVLRDGALVQTFSRRNVDRPTLVRAILGRELTEFRSESAPAPTTGAAVVACSSLSSPPELKDLTFQLHQGEVLGFFGLLGAGQSAVAEALFGLRPAKAQRASINSIDGLPSSPAEGNRRGIAYVPSDRKNVGLAMRLSILDNLIMPDLWSVSQNGVIRWEKARARARDAISQYGVRCQSISQIVSELSGGNQQKISVAKWAARKAAIMAVDEPSRGVDVGARVEIYRFIRDFAQHGGAAIVASSDASEICDLCDRVIVMKQGRLSAALSGTDISETNLLAAAL